MRFKLFLTWDAVDFDNKTIAIHKSWDSKHHRFKDTKNTSSYRTIKVNPSLLKVLLPLKKHHKSSRVFVNQYGTIPTSNAVNDMLTKLLDNLGIHKMNFTVHALRHAQVALLLANHIDLYSISRRLGHSSIKTTANTYAYLIEEFKKKTNRQIIDGLESL